VALFIKTSSDSVDPAEAERLIDGFLPCDRGLSRSFLVEADEQFGSLVVILLEPFSKFVRRLKECRLHDFFDRIQIAAPALQAASAAAAIISMRNARRNATSTAARMRRRVVSSRFRGGSASTSLVLCDSIAFPLPRRASRPR